MVVRFTLWSSEGRKAQEAPLSGFLAVPIGLLQDVGDGSIAEDKAGALHRRRVRSRNTAMRPFFGSRLWGVDLTAGGGGDQFRLQIAKAALFVLPDQFPDVLAGGAPVAGSYAEAARNENKTKLIRHR
jgi:hypothetical protein